MIRDVIDGKEAVNVDSKYLSGVIATSSADGRKLHISGLIGDIPFKTGQCVSEGEIAGKTEYSTLKEPHIQLFLSARNTMSGDVVTAFSLCNLVVLNGITGFKGVIVRPGVRIVCGILFGTEPLIFSPTTLSVTGPSPKRRNNGCKSWNSINPKTH